MPQQLLCACRQEVADRLSALAQADSVRTQELSARQDNLERSLREVGAGCQAFAQYCHPSHRGSGAVTWQHVAVRASASPKLQNVCPARVAPDLLLDCCILPSEAAP